MLLRSLAILYLVAPACTFVVERIRTTQTTSLFSTGETISIPSHYKLWKDDVPDVQIVDKMPDNLPLDMKHKYYLLRHGQSTANVAEIISSARSLAYTNQHGLTATGYDQGFESASCLTELLAESAQQGDRVVLVSSPLARARETAQACLDGLFQNETNAKRLGEELGVVVSKHIFYHDLLVERNFGRLDGEGGYCGVILLSRCDDDAFRAHIVSRLQPFTLMRMYGHWIR